ncbi:hypothetical protein SSX86_016900 [Deinandra increscens subsp. villosa]|uniref:DNA repair metallo-beta-lactamase domain-containing protein n=1 Tax=Deinandra increscens subsp. villosa TaxID=3103831 RepID=A0AAP0GXZ9_9ASTR
MPSKHVAIRQVIDCIWKHPDALVVYLTCDLLDIISQDPSSRFHLFDGYPRLSERAEAKLAEARANLQPDPLIIRPSTQWYVFEDVSAEVKKQKVDRFKEARRDQFGIWHVCYSMHSSRDELEWALQLLAPRWVVSTTPECRAMELSYVKRHCSYGDLGLWKLLDISLEAPFVDEKIHQEVSCSASPFVMSQLESSQEKETLTVSSQFKESPVTLFGRARLGLNNSTFRYEEDSVKPEISYLEEDVKVELSNNMCSTDREVSEGEHVESKSKELTKGVVKQITATTGVGENIRKLYRSMHVPVPKPLPSLVDLLNDRKRAKRRFLS